MRSRNRQPGEPTLGADSAYRQATPNDRQYHTADTTHRWPLQAAGQHVQQHPYRGNVLQNNRQRHRCLLNSVEIEEIGRGNPEDSQQKELHQIVASDPQ